MTSDPLTGLAWLLAALLGASYLGGRGEMHLPSFVLLLVFGAFYGLLPRSVWRLAVGIPAAYYVLRFAAGAVLYRGDDYAG